MKQKGFALGFIPLSGVACLLLAGGSITSLHAAEAHVVHTNQESQSKTITVKGTVVDANGETVIGATVLLVEDTSKGMLTDLDGQFTLSNVPANGTIRISYIGMKTVEIPINGQTNLTITLVDDTEMLDEVVVTALGMKRSTKALGYAVTELKGDELASANTINPIASLQGKVSGVDIKGSDGGLFGGTKIQIRGASTLGSNNQPIYVVDGVILDNDISGSDDLNWSPNAGDYGNMLKNLNPDDFESVSVLKGAAATALYGSRGLNGAVVITTKGGKAHQGLGITFSQTFGVDHVFDTPKLQMEYGPGMWAGYNTSDPDGNRFNLPQLLNNGEGVPSLIQSSNVMWGPKVDPSLQVEQYDKTISPWTVYPNHYRDMFNVGFNSNTNLSLQGGTADANFFTSTSYRKANGTTPNNSFDRFSLFGKGFIRPIDWLGVTVSFNWTRSDASNAPINFGEYFVQLELANDYNPNYYKDMYLGDHGGIAQSQYGDKYGYVPGRGLWFGINNSDTYQLEDVLRPTIQLDFTLTDWMRLVLEGNMNYYTIKSESKGLGGGYANEGGYYGISHRTQDQKTFMATLFLNKQWDKLNVGGFVRGETFNQTNSFTSVSTDGGLIVPGQYFIGNSKNTPIYDGGVDFTKRINSLVFSANLSWDDTYFLDVTGRNDWSSALIYSDGTGNYSYFYPSVSGSWIFSNTFEMPDWVTFGKLRASWAQVGNDTAPYFINTAYGLDKIERADGFIYTNSVPNRLFDPNIKPERKNAFEVGADVRFLNNRIGLDVTYYKENTKDQIIEIKIPWISGADRQLINAGNIQNSGWELALHTVPVQTKDWEWTVDATYTRNRNQIIELHPNVTSYIELQGQPNNYDYRIGSVAMVPQDGGYAPYGVLMSDIAPKVNEKGEKVLQWSDSGRGALYARSGKVEEVGDMNPDFLASLRTGLRWKNLNLNIALDGRYGGMVASYANRYGTAYGVTEASLQYRDEAHGGMTWTSNYAESQGITYHDGVVPEGVFDEGTMATFVDGTKHDVSGMSYKQLVEEGKLEPTHAGFWHYFSNSWGQGTLNDNWFSELKYIALREIGLTYNFDRTLLEPIRANALSLSFTARNLGYLYNSLPNNLHPESVRGNRAGEFRIRAYQEYTANYMFTVSVSF
ncbi:MAG: SusC/RagA family TonB-linked outer membrane protein [Porphyromonas sp.]|nr:SusC/RagA family TonB-linked outer membrane protein [Porphyromonas sp.]